MKSFSFGVIAISMFLTIAHNITILMVIRTSSYESPTFAMCVKNEVFIF